MYWKKKKKDALLHFHSVVGDELDCVATTLHNIMSSLLQPASYYEYCVYRSIHEFRLIGLTRSARHIIPCRNIDSESSSSNKKKQSSGEDIEAMAGYATFSIIHMVLQAQYSLKRGGSAPIDSADWEEYVVSDFENAVINTSSSESQSRCRSMLMMLDLQREASKIISSTQLDKDKPSKSAKGGLHIAHLAVVIGRCLAPLEAKLARSTKDQLRSLTFRLSSSDCYVKSASLFDEASSMVSNEQGEVGVEEYRIEADSHMSKSYDLLVKELGRLDKDNVDRKSPQVAAVEVFAKVSILVITSWLNYFLV